jgi:hypothetical protein
MIRRLIPADFPEVAVHVVDGGVEGDDGCPLVSRRPDAVGLHV